MEKKIKREKRSPDKKPGRRNGGQYMEEGTARYVRDSEIKRKKKETESHD